MQKENLKNQSQTESSALQCWEQSLELIAFFYTYTGKEIKEDSKALKFWQKALYETELMNDQNYRKEFQRVVDLVDALDALSNKFTPQQIEQTIANLEKFRNLTTKELQASLGSEVSHV